MKNNNSESSLVRWQRSILLLIGIILGALLFFLRGGLAEEAPLDELARNSPTLESALANNHPTIIEFYADWCEACRKMAPAMLELSREKKDKIDFIFLNVDNTLWRDVVETYEVNGIPQLDFFDESGELKGKSLGVRSCEDLQAISSALLNGETLPEQPGIGLISEISKSPLNNEVKPSSEINPRSHG